MPGQGPSAPATAASPSSSGGPILVLFARQGATHCMHWSARPPQSLKTRLVLSTLLVLVLGLWSMAYDVGQALRTDLLKLVGQQQVSTATVLSERIADEVALRLDALEALSTQLGAAAGTDAGAGARLVGARLESARLADAAWVRSVLAQDRLADRLFNNGVLFAGTDGVARAASRPALGQEDGDYSAQLATVFATGQAGVGPPIAGRQSRQPLLVLAVPLRDRSGALVGALAGVVDLARPNFVDPIIRHRYGETGHLFLVAPRQRLVVTTSDASRIMQRLPPPGANAEIDRVLAGYQGTVQLTNAQGVAVLSSGRQVPRAGWDVVVSMPLQEALAPAQRLASRVLAAAALLTVVLGGLVWWLIGRQLAPATAAAHALAAQAQAPGPPRPLPEGQADEVGTLIAAFNRTLAALAAREADLRLSDLVLQSITEAVVITGPDQAVLSVNQAHVTITGYSQEELIGHNLRLLQGPLTDPATVAGLRQALAAQAAFACEILNYRKDGLPFWNDLLVSPVRDTQGRLTHFVGITRDVTQRKQAEQQIHHLAFNDSLTQLPNRRLLDDRLDQALAASRRHGWFGALMFVDIDGLKQLNDQHGHALGDQLLVQVAQRLQASVRQIDTVARFGGDEFVVLLAQLSADASTSAADARGVAEKIRSLLAMPYALAAATADGAAAGLPALDYSCSASIGISLFMGQQPDARKDDLLRRADAAMYRAKQAGRNTIVLDGSTG